ncbi:MAG: transcriptional regulator [Candidatus Bathyarchaeia archaeon]
MKRSTPPLFCELAVKAVIPTIRAMVAKELSTGHMMKQHEVALALGLTQSAISQYLRNIRGNTLNLEGVEGVEELVKELAEMISSGNASFSHINSKFCEACRLVRETRLLCCLHKKVDPDFEVDDCNTCASTRQGC